MKILQSVKDYLRIDGVDNDPIILELIESAIDYIY